MSNSKFLIALCFEDSFHSVESFPTADLRAAFGRGVVEGALKYGAGSIGTYHWPDESADMKSELPDVDYKAALKAIAEIEAS